MSQLVLAALVFLGLHLLPSTPLRPWAVGRLGEKAYMGAFSLLSLGGLIWLIAAYNAAPTGEPLWVIGPLWRWANALLMLAVLVLLVAGALSPNPAVAGGAAALRRKEPWRGVFAVTRHPLMWAIGAWGVLHLINRPEPASFVFFGSLSLLAVGGAWLQDARKRRELGADWQPFEAHTSFVPFAALIAGRARLALGDVGWWRLAVAVVLWAALLHFHAWLFGVPAIPV